jgi:sugar O-acyltransferase (sialic acid O-acetyltransferase NeuD family)
MNYRAVALGAGGHARVLIDAARSAGQCEIVGLLDPATARHGTLVDGVPVRGGDELLAQIRAEGVECGCVGVGAPNASGIRARLFDLLREHGFQPLTIVHRSATVSPTAVVGTGSALFAGSIINAGAVVADNCIVNSGAIIEHDCRIGPHAHISTGARLAGGVVVGAGAFVGIGAIVREQITIGDHAIVGAGAVVIDNVPAGAVVAGVPARPL